MMKALIKIHIVLFFFGFVCLLVVYIMLPVSLDCKFLIPTLVFYNVQLTANKD